MWTELTWPAASCVLNARKHPQSTRNIRGSLTALAHGLVFIESLLAVASDVQDV